MPGFKRLKKERIESAWAVFRKTKTPDTRGFLLSGKRVNDYRFFFEAFFFATFFVAFFADFFFAAFFFAAIELFDVLIIICDDRPLYCDWTRYHHM